ncbi:hypothetical protein [Flavobacterium ajazii]|uniref:hypothetical protein n=1 Tax=Flavobacterium ajazii TaxID=2692318 RepID=UPI0013D663A5|nr:hypothetical protein [Flavobacterium ajazii]
MTIQEYYNKMSTLIIEGNIPQFLDSVSLENIVLKIIDDGDITCFTPGTLFYQSDSKFAPNNEIIQWFADRSGLLFLFEKEPGNVCFANSDELRPEFRQSFTIIDMLDYMYAFVHSSYYKEFQKIVIPSEAHSFWKLVEIGSRLRKDNT